MSWLIANSENSQTREKEWKKENTTASGEYEKTLPMRLLDILIGLESQVFLINPSLP